MKFGIHLNGITFHQLTGCFEISLALDALHFCQQTGKELTESIVIHYLHIGFPIALDESNGIAILQTPMGY